MATADLGEVGIELALPRPIHRPQIMLVDIIVGRDSNPHLRDQACRACPVFANKNRSRTIPGRRLNKRRIALVEERTKPMAQELSGKMALVPGKSRGVGAAPLRGPHR